MNREFSSAAAIGPPVKVYPLYLPVMARITIFTVLSLFTLLGVLMTTGVMGGPQNRFFGVFWLCAVGVSWYKVLTTPHRIEVSADGRATFVSIARRVQVSPFEVESIKPRGNQIGYFLLRHSNGRIAFIGQFDGFHEFLTDLKAANPRVELRGC